MSKYVLFEGASLRVLRTFLLCGMLIIVSFFTHETDNKCQQEVVSVNEDWDRILREYAEDDSSIDKVMVLEVGESFILAKYLESGEEIEIYTHSIERGITVGDLVSVEIECGEIIHETIPPRVTALCIKRLN